MSVGPLYDAIRARRVTRNMTAEPVDPEDLELVIRAARYAPNAGNRRLQVVVPVTDAALLRALRALSPGMIPRPAAAAVICIDTARAIDYGFDATSPGSSSTSELPPPQCSWRRRPPGSAPAP